MPDNYSSKPQRPNQEPENLLDYLKTHTREVISYIILVLGIVLMFFQPLYGGFLVGVIAGIYFGNSIVDFIKNWKTEAESSLFTRNVILAGIAFAFFIAAPAIFLGIAFAVAIKYLFGGLS